MTTKQPGQPNRFWLAFTVSSFEMPIAFAFGLYGLFSLIFSDFLTPPSVEVTYQFWVVVIWHLMLGAGGTLTFVGRLFEWERTELVGLACFGLGCLYYLGAASLVLGNAAFGLIVLLLSLVWACVTRMWVLRRSLKAQEIARNVVEIVQHNQQRNGGTQ